MQSRKALRKLRVGLDDIRRRRKTAHRVPDEPTTGTPARRVHESEKQRTFRRSVVEREESFAIGNL